MFLYGMHTMSDGIQKSAGNKMRQLLEMLTNNRLMAVLMGALITAIIQSSGATTVMVVGFVNAGLMTLTQAVGVIMGANIESAQLLLCLLKNHRLNWREKSWLVWACCLSAWIS